MSHILALDQGTSSSRSIVFDAQGRIVAMAQRELTQHFPQPGWVEHDPMEIWATQLATAQEAIAKAGLTAADIRAIGITNQRETTLLWNRRTGKPLHHAIVWQDRRTEPFCAQLRAQGLEPMVRHATGLRIDPYFSATKLRWLLDHVKGAHVAAAHGDLAFGTVDSWLLWQLTGGAVHATDVSNASRTMLFDIRHNVWDRELLKALHVPDSVLPRVRSRGTTMAHIARAALESIAFQSAALLQAMDRDARAGGGAAVSELRVDGGASVNDLLMQFQADLLGAKGLLLRSGTVVDATLIAAPSSTKNASGQRDPEMKQSRKGQQWYFGMKCHIGVDADSGLVHTVRGTGGHVNDVVEAASLLHGQERDVFADAGYQGAGKRADAPPGVQWHIAMKPGQRRVLDPADPIEGLTEQLERLKARIRAKVEHPFRVVKRQFGHVKVRYRGLAKNTAQLHTLFALANLWLARRQLLGAGA